MKKLLRVLFFVLLFGLIGGKNVYATCCVGNPCTPVGSDGQCAGNTTPSDDNTCVQWCGNANGTSPGSAGTGTTASPVTGASNSTSGSTTFTNPIGFTSITALLTSVLTNLMGIIATVAVLFIVIGGVMYVTSGGNSDMITRAKKTWTGAAIGLAIALGAPAFLNTIKQILGSNGGTQNGQSLISSNITIQTIVANTLNLLLSIFGILAIIALVVGGGTYLTAYGDEKKIDTGKKIITYAIIGIVVALAALVIVQQISYLLGAS
jgi:hypothetical protein